MARAIPRCIVIFIGDIELLLQAGTVLRRCQVVDPTLQFSSVVLPLNAVRWHGGRTLRLVAGRE
jgi:hypothetical protein